ncbi:hypothetical protein HMPREF1548_04423 [Clostridium sp. KLE 1755]|nr:hypothetical protein HMPREF1548_04423 [Clostridium sp. KLE 1755]
MRLWRKIYGSRKDISMSFLLPVKMLKNKKTKNRQFIQASASC